MGHAGHPCITLFFHCHEHQNSLARTPIELQCLYLVRACHKRQAGSKIEVASNQMPRIMAWSSCQSRILVIRRIQHPDLLTDVFVRR